MAHLCEICNQRVATRTVRVTQNGVERDLHVCDQDLDTLYRRQRRSPFDDFFGGGDPFSDFGGLTSQLGYPLPRDREAVDVTAQLSEHTKELVQEAGQAAVALGRKELDTEHLLLALTKSEVVDQILGQFKVKTEDLKGYIESNAPKGEDTARKGETIELEVSPRVKNVIQRSVSVARELGHGYVGPEHLLIGLAEEDDGLAGDILRKYGLTSEALRQKVVKVVGKGAKEGRVDKQSTTPQLDKYSRDLSQMAKAGKLDPVIGRADEIETTIEILSRRTKNNPVLIGEPGVGKTAIVEGLAQRIESGHVPEVLEGKRVVELSINSMVAGSKYRGEFEERIKTVLDEITQHQDELIVFVDELHTIVGAGSAGEEGGLDVANTLKPALARGELHLIGATTLNEYQKHIEKDAALERRLQPVFVPEPTVEQTAEIIRGLRDRYEAHHRVKITDEAIVAASELSDRYITNRFLPDKAIDLIDQAASRVRIQFSSHSADIKALDEELAGLKREHEYAQSRKDYAKTKELDRRIKKVESKKEAATGEWRRKRGATSAEVTKQHIAQVVSKLTGVPVSELTEEEKNKLLKMEERIRERIVGQSEAVTAVSNAVRLSRAGLAESSKPVATFLFLGPTGVGKTELAKALAWNVFGDEDAVTRIDMSEYMERHAVSRLIGSPPGYVGHDEGGQLTEQVRRRPYSVILLDEIEKAHPDVYNVLLQVFDDGRLTDGKGRVVDFSNTIIIATSNLGSELIQANLKQKGGDKKSYEQLKESLDEVLRGHFRPEFLNRIDEVIVFHALTKDEIKSIVGLQLERVKRTARGQGIELVIDASAMDHLAEKGYLPEYGARELRRTIKTEIESPLAKLMLGGQVTEGSTVTATLKGDKKTIVLEPAKEGKKEAATA